MSWEAYFESEKRNVQKKQKLIEQRKALARTIASNLSQLLVEKYHVQKVILIGSVTSSRFSLESDIDLAIEGLNPEYYFRAWSDVNDASSFKVDLIDLDHCQPTMLTFAEKGDVLHDCKKK